ncbi:hypothetical protein OAO01_05395 [Oligoflexia bacterium]|nr:hypothetical protein [Oligoflexia bacterium]
MQTISWITFGVSNAVAKTVVHFFPSAGNVSAPYPAHCKLSWFGQGSVSKTVTVDGPRLSQPDGVRLDAVFKDLDEGASGFIGVEIALSTVQPRIDLTSSACVVELASRAYSARFRPICLNRDTTQASGHGPGSSGPGLALNDSYNTSSVVVVNRTANNLEPKLVSLRTEGVAASVKAESAVALGSESSGEITSDALGGPVVPPYSVHEIKLGESFFEAQAPKQCSWGLLRSRNVVLSEALPLGAACYMLYRNSVTKVPVSVRGL